MSHSSNVGLLQMEPKYITDDVLIKLGYKECFHYAWVQILSRMGPLLPLGLASTLLPDTGLSKLTKSEQNYFQARIECY